MRNYYSLQLSTSKILATFSTPVNTMNKYRCLKTHIHPTNMLEGESCVESIFTHLPDGKMYLQHKQTGLLIAVF